MDEGVFKQKQNIEDLAQQLSHQLQQKPDFQDLEAIAHKIHTKVDFEKMQEMF